MSATFWRYLVATMGEGGWTQQRQYANFIAANWSKLEEAARDYSRGTSPMEMRNVDEGEMMCMTPLKLAACLGELEIVKNLISHGVSVNSGGVHKPALTWAASNGKDAVVVALLDAGASVSGGEERALYHAARNGHISTVQLLLSKGAHANEISGMWLTALHGACLSTAAEGIKFLVPFLLSYGAEPNARNDNGNTPLEYLLSSVCSGEFEVVPAAECLLDAGADPQIMPLQLAKPTNQAATNFMRTALLAGYKVQPDYSEQYAIQASALHTMWDAAHESTSTARMRDYAWARRGAAVGMWSGVWSSQA